MNVYISDADQGRYLDLADKLRNEASEIEELACDIEFPIDIVKIITWESLDKTLKR